MAKLALYYDRSPLDIGIGELEEYLYFLIQKGTDSQSSFKHLVFGLPACRRQPACRLPAGRQGRQGRQGSIRVARENTFLELIK